VPPGPVPAWILRRRLQVGSRIRSLREHRGYTQPDLAHHAGISRDTVFRAENGTYALKIDQAFLMAHALNVPVDWFFRDDWVLPDGDATS
jgi:transcriptional regulator with XRE-family HTH domain